VLRSNAHPLRSNTLAKSATFAWLRSIVVPALERTSAAAAVDPRQCMCSVFYFFLFYLIFSFCLFILPMFLVFVSIINCLISLIFCLVY
jgi:hypothetical protein